jgi:hypothetical protein
MILYDVSLLPAYFSGETVQAQNFETARKSRVGVRCGQLHSHVD